MIWRYMDVAKYVVLLERGLFFAQPSKLGDVWDGAWGVPDVRGFREDHANADHATISAEWKRRYDAKTAFLDGYGVSCWHGSDDESAALWSLYMPRGFGVAVRSTVQHVLDSLRKSDRAVEPREVRYVDYDTEHLGDDPRDLLSYKRRSFAHEKELRFLLAFREDERAAIDDWALILTDRTQRHFSAGRFQRLVRSGATPARVVTDPALVLRATPHGVYLPAELPVLVQKVILAPLAPWPVRHAYWPRRRRSGCRAASSASPKPTWFPLTFSSLSKFPTLPNNTFDRTAGSHSLAAAGQRERSLHDNAMMVYPRLR